MQLKSFLVDETDWFILKIVNTVTLDVLVTEVTKTAEAMVFT